MQVTIGIRNVTDNVGKDLTIFGSLRIRATFLNSIPLFSKCTPQTSSDGFILGLGHNVLYILDSIVSMTWWEYLENRKLEGISHNFTFKSLFHTG